MKGSTPHNQVAAMAMSRIAELGVALPMQQRIGAFVIYWGLYEAHLEGAIWKLTAEDVSGVRPSTDKKPVSDWFEVLARGSDDLSVDANRILEVAAQASENLLAYRNSLIHGTLLSFPGSNSVTFLRNPRWSGEVRKREAGDAHVDENLLDMAIEAAWVLFRLALCIKQDAELEVISSQLEQMQPDLGRANALAGELRYLTALMNHEKY